MIKLWELGDVRRSPVLGTFLDGSCLCWPDSQVNGDARNAERTCGVVELSSCRYFWFFIERQVMTISNKFSRNILALAFAASLVACGGGSGSSVSGAVLKGVAATGAAMANATVTATCLPISGTASVVTTSTTDANGAYVVTAANGKPPCIVSAVRTVGTVTTTLTSIALSEGTVNVNPITNLLVQGLLVGKNAPNAASLLLPAYAPTTNDVAVAQTAVIVEVNKALVAAGLPTIVAGTDLVAGGFTVGSAADKALDNLVVIKAITATGDASPALKAAVVIAVDAAVPTNPGTPTGGTGGTGGG